MRLRTRPTLLTNYLLYHSGLASWIWTWCAQGRTRGDSPPDFGLGKPGVA